VALLRHCAALLGCCTGPHLRPFSQLMPGILFGFWVSRPDTADMAVR
jgi:hypothetical protein